MALFTAPFQSVSNTSIFARSLPEGRQVVVYETFLTANEDVAMILPIPVKPGSGEKAVQFVNLSGYDGMLEDVERAFPTGNAVDGCFFGPDAEVLEATYAPSLADLAKQEERFRLPPRIWERLPHYREFGFVVFKIRADKTPVKPLAFAFPRRDPAQLYFPTLHVHGGEVPAEQEFHHVLYCQKIPGETFALQGWRESPELPAGMVNVVAAQGIVDPRLHLYRRELKGRLPNTDTVLA